MYLEFLLRSPNGSHTETAIQIAIAYTWQEGPDDLRIQFERVSVQRHHDAIIRMKVWN